MKKLYFGFFLVEASIVRKTFSLKSIEVKTGGRCLIECILEVLWEKDHGLSKENCTTGGNKKRSQAVSALESLSQEDLN